MSLPNPNKPVTEQRLYEFYQKIKTRLGFTEMPAEDMSDIINPLPSVINRKFKYSTEEQIIGEWMDGKPIYQKTFVIDKTTMASIPLDYSSYNIITSLVNIKQIVSLQSYLSQYDTNLEGVYDATYYQDNTLKLKTWFRNFDKIGFAWEGWNPNTKDFELLIIIQYTKTTD